MARAEKHVAELLKLPIDERAKAARELLASLDPGPDDPNAPDAQSAELIRRVSAFETGEVKLVNAAEARERVMARLRAFRPK